MKKMQLFLALASIASLSLSGCDNMTIRTDNASGAEISGNGNVQSQRRAVTTFDKIEINGVFNVFLSQGEKEEVRVETDENIQPLILTTVENNVLSVRMRDSASIGKIKKINVYIAFHQLQKIASNGVGKLTCENTLKVDKLDLDFNGVGISSLKVEGNILNISSEIVGALKLAGNMKEVNINHSGLGVIQAFDLKSEKLTLDADGIGAADVYASRQLNVNSRGVGVVRYKGNPETTNIKNEGIGKVEKAE